MYTCNKYFMKFTKHLARKTRRRKTIIIAAFSSLALLLVFFNSDYSPDLYFINFEPHQDVSCHFVRQGDALPPIDERFLPSANSIFFHETSCNARLNTRQACSIESAARAHPNWEIHVIFSAPINKRKLNDINLVLLRLLNNVFFSRVLIVDYAKGTPLQELVKGGVLNRTRWPMSHASDILRFLSLYKWGGVYLDMDMVVVKPLGGLGMNWAARENNLVVSAGAFSLQRNSLGSFFANALTRTLARTFRGDVWGQNGPLVITKVMEAMCKTKDVTKMTADKCLGIEVHPPALFYPLTSKRPEEFLQPGDLNLSSEAYTYHLWNQGTQKFNISAASPYAKLAKRFCPFVYDTYRNKFGI